MLIVCLLLVVALACSAQDLQYLHHQAWTTEEGLPQNSVHSILQTQDGFIWVATEGGIARFDGVSFKVFQSENEPAFTSNDVCCLAQDGAGDLWIGTADGLLRYGAGHFQRFSEREGMPANSVSSLSVAPDGHLLAITTNGLASWSGNGFRAIAPQMPVAEKLESAGNAGTWLTSQSKIYLLHNGILTLRTPEQTGTLKYPLGITSAPDGSTWIFSARAVQVTSQGKTRVWRTGKDLPAGRVGSLTVDRSNYAWVGTSNGLAVLTKETAAAMPTSALQHDAILCSFQDREGNLWIGGETSGLHILRSLRFRSEPALTGTSLTSVIQARDGAMWTGTRDDGLRRFRNGLVDVPVPSSSLSSPVVLALAAGSDGSVWAGTPDGLNSIIERKIAHIYTATNGLPDNYIRSLATDPDGSVWVGTRRGLAHIHGGQISTLTTADGLGGDLIGSLAIANPGGNERLWIGTSGGLSVLRRDGSIETYTARDGFHGAIVTALAQDPSGIVWVATRDGGLSRFDGRHSSRIESSAFDGEIESMLADNRGFLWIRRLRGIAKVSLTDLNHCQQTCTPSVVSYSLADGFPSDEMIAGGSPALWQTVTGELWFPTRRGIAITDQAHIQSAVLPAPVVIERFLVDESALDVDTSPKIPYGRTRFTLEYAGLSYTVPSQTRYRFLLEGFDPGWTDAGPRRAATYTNLPPGDYRFRVQAAGSDGIWNEGGAELRFRVIPPFYRRWWFILLVLLALTALGVVIYRLRLRRLRRQFDAVLQERNRMAREIHDTLAQDFVGVSIQLDIVAQMLGHEHVEAAANQVRQTRKLVQDGLAEARRSIWELRANVTHDSLPARLTKVTERYTSPALPIRIEVGGIFRKLDSRLEDEVLRIAQESLSNIQRHSGAAEAAIELRYERDMLVLVVEDNGRGFPPNEGSPDGHFGIRGMRERAATINGTLDLDSKPGIGTKVTLSVPIAKGK